MFLNSISLWLSQKRPHTLYTKEEETIANPSSQLRISLMDQLVAGGIDDHSDHAAVHSKKNNFAEENVLY